MTKPIAATDHVISKSFRPVSRIPPASLEEAAPVKDNAIVMQKIEQGFLVADSIRFRTEAVKLVAFQQAVPPMRGRPRLIFSWQFAQAVPNLNSARTNGQGWAPVQAVTDGSRRVEP